MKKDKYLEDRVSKITVDGKDLFTGGSYHKDTENYFKTNLPSASVKELILKDIEIDSESGARYYKVKDIDKILIFKVSSVTVLLLNNLIKDGYPITIINDTEGLLLVGADFFNMGNLLPTENGYLEAGMSMTVIRYKNKVYLLSVTGLDTGSGD